MERTPPYANLVLFSGCRWAGKSVSACHALCMHAWETNRGNILVLTLTQSVGVDSGVWQDIIEITQIWIDGNFGMEWVKEPYLDAGTKKPAFVVRNKWGTATKVQLDSLKNEEEVEGRYKGKRYSMIFVNEFSKFNKRKTFDTLKQALRMMHLKEEDHLFLADTNPDLDLGKNSPWYQLWYEFRTMSDEDIADSMKKKAEDGVFLPPDTGIPLRNSLKLVEFTMDDNLSLSKEKKSALMADFAHDSALLDAYYYGKWVTASVDALFYKVFRPNFHVRGDDETRSNPNPMILVPDPGTWELYDGYDLGVSNSAAVIMDKSYRIDKFDSEIEGVKTVVERKVPVFKMLDELVVLDEDFSMEEFILEFMRKRDFWEAYLGRPNKIVWHSWSDRSAFDMQDVSSKRYHHQTVFQASEGKILLQAAERGGGSVALRVDLFRKLLFDERFFMCRSRCPHAINMCRSIRKGKNALSVIAKGSPFKHVFDAITYLVASECYDELNREITLNMRRSNESSLIQVAV